MYVQGAGVIFVHNQQIGLGLRGNNVPAPNHWGSIGGKSENNETPIQTAIRETREETNIILDPQNLILFDKFEESNGFVYWTFLYPCDPDIILKQFCPTDEIVDLKFMDIDKILSPTLLNSHFIQKLQHQLIKRCPTAENILNPKTTHFPHDL